MTALVPPVAGVLSPLLVAPVLALIPRRRPGWTALAAGVGLALQGGALVAAGLYLGGGTGAGAPAPAGGRWLAGVGATLDLGIDALSLGPALLVPLLCLGVLAVTWREAGSRLRERALALALTAAASVALVTARDLLLMVSSLQVAALGTAFLLGSGTRAARRAALRFAAHHLAAAFLLLAVTLALLSLGEGGRNTSLAALTRVDVPPRTGTLLLAATALAFAVPLAAVPVHTWLIEAAAAGSRAGALLSVSLCPLLGAYGMARVCLEILPGPAVAWGHAGAGLAAAAAVYAALIAAVQAEPARRLAWVHVALLAPVCLCLCTVSAEGMAAALVLACAQAPVRLALLAMARPPAPRLEPSSGAARWWLVLALALVGVPGSGAFAGGVLAVAAVAPSWPAWGLVTLLAVGLASAAAIAPYFRLRRGEEGVGLGLTRSARLLAAGALLLSLAMGLHPATALRGAAGPDLLAAPDGSPGAAPLPADAGAAPAAAPGGTGREGGEGGVP